LFKKYSIDTRQCFVENDSDFGGNHSLLNFPENIGSLHRHFIKEFFLPIDP
jgi:hypothetical protein